MLATDEPGYAFIVDMPLVRPLPWGSRWAFALALAAPKRLKMKRFFAFVARHRRGRVLAVALLAAGACFRWEVAEIDDAKSGQRIATHHRVVPPWHPCGASGGGRLINFHVRHWLCYGLVQIEATGQTM